MDLSFLDVSAKWLFQFLMIFRKFFIKNICGLCHVKWNSLDQGLLTTRYSTTTMPLRRLSLSNSLLVSHDSQAFTLKSLPDVLPYVLSGLVLGQMLGGSPVNDKQEPVEGPSFASHTRPFHFSFRTDSVRGVKCLCCALCVRHLRTRPPVFCWRGAALLCALERGQTLLFKSSDKIGERQYESVYIY